MTNITWQRWFAWFPVRIHNRLHWLRYVIRDQYANRPSHYNYGTSLRADKPWLVDREGVTYLPERKVVLKAKQSKLQA